MCGPAQNNGRRAPDRLRMTEAQPRTRSWHWVASLNGLVR
jgi:hypothetical protein